MKVKYHQGGYVVVYEKKQDALQAAQQLNIPAPKPEIAPSGTFADVYDAEDIVEMQAQAKATFFGA